MKLTLSPSRDQSKEEFPHVTVSVDDPRDDLQLEEVVSMFRGVLLAAGYDEKSVRERLGDV